MENGNEPRSDERLFLNGGDAAMTQLVGRYERPLYRFLVNLVGDVHLAEDLFQETFLRLHRSRSNFQSGARLKPYLYRIALNAARDAHTKKRKSARKISLDGSSGPPGDSPGETGEAVKTHLPDGEPEPGANVEQAELRTRMQSAVKRLPESEREVVLLRVFDGLSFPEIAEVTGVPIPTAKSRMLYALRRLRPLMEGYIAGGR